jgi:hypothetical protein
MNTLEERVIILERQTGPEEPVSSAAYSDSEGGPGRASSLPTSREPSIGAEQGQAAGTFSVLQEPAEQATPPNQDQSRSHPHSEEKTDDEPH